MCESDSLENSSQEISFLVIITCFFPSRGDLSACSDARPGIHYDKLGKVGQHDRVEDLQTDGGGGMTNCSSFQ